MTPRLRSPISLDETLAAAQLLVRTPFFLRRRIDPATAKAILRERLLNRERDFLALLQSAVYQHPPSPYRKLLSSAGCEYGDVVRLVTERGLEGALSSLHSAGVYLTVDEFKGRQPAVRGSGTFELDPRALRNPGTGFHVLSQTSGSRGSRTRIPIDLAHVADRVVDLCLNFEARGGLHWRFALWGFPGGAGTINTLLFSGIGRPPARWFSRLDLDAAGVPARYRWNVRLLRLAALAGGVALPATEYVPLERPARVAEWLPFGVDLSPPVVGARLRD